MTINARKIRDLIQELSDPLFAIGEQKRTDANSCLGSRAPIRGVNVYFRALRTVVSPLL